MKTTIALISFLAIIGCDAFSTVDISGGATRGPTELMARGGRGMKKQKLPKKKGAGIAGDSSSAGGFSGGNWISMPSAASELKSMQDGQVKLFDTNAITIKNAMTNPTAAVSVLKHNEETFCFSHACPSCQIPLNKGKVLPVTSSRPSPLLACTFCKSAYDLKTGTKTEVDPNEIAGGLFAGLAQNLFKAQGKNDPLPIYKLGERDGQLVVSLD